MIGNDPVEEAVPESTADPLPLSLKLTPLGNEPLSLREGVGVPVAVTVKLATEPAVKLALPMLVITGAMGAGLTVSVRFLTTVCGGFSESLTCTVKLKEPCTDGVPAIIPVEGFRLSPEGNDPPIRLQLYGGSPPDTVRGAL